MGDMQVTYWQMQKFMWYYTVFALFYFEFEGNFQVKSPRVLYLEGRFIGEFFALSLEAYFWNFTVSLERLDRILFKQHHIIFIMYIIDLKVR